MYSRSKKYFDLEIVSKSLFLMDKNTKYRAQKPKRDSYLLYQPD